MISVEISNAAFQGEVGPPVIDDEGYRLNVGFLGCTSTDCTGNDYVNIGTKSFHGRYRINLKSRLL